MLAALPGRLLASAKNAELEDGSKKKDENLKTDVSVLADAQLDKFLEGDHLVVVGCHMPSGLLVLVLREQITVGTVRQNL